MPDNGERDLSRCTWGDKLSYKIEIDGDMWAKESSKDDVIQMLMAFISADGTSIVKVTYPDGTYYEYGG